MFGPKHALRSWSWGTELRMQNGEAQANHVEAAWSSSQHPGSHYGEVKPTGLCD